MEEPARPLSASPPGDLFALALQQLRRRWGLFLGLGIALILLGGLAIGASVIATLVTVIFIGSIILCEGILQVLLSFWARHGQGFFLHLVTGFLGVIVGLLLITKPVTSAIALTLLMATFFVVGGLFRMVAATMIRFRGRAWVFVSGLVEFTLGILIWAEWPASPSDQPTLLWVIGTFVGINLIFRGWSYVVLATALRTLPASSAPTP
jgi:uncharacterized membrane protein HdeD (DUF308 family)